MSQTSYCRAQNTKKPSKYMFLVTVRCRLGCINNKTWTIKGLQGHSSLLRSRCLGLSCNETRHWNGCEGDKRVLGDLDSLRVVTFLNIFEQIEKKVNEKSQDLRLGYSIMLIIVNLFQEDCWKDTQEWFAKLECVWSTQYMVHFSFCCCCCFGSNLANFWFVAFNPLNKKTLPQEQTKMHWAGRASGP